MTTDPRRRNVYRSGCTGVHQAVVIYIREASRLTRDIEFVELVPTAPSLQAAYKRQMLNSFYLRPDLDISPRP